MAKKKAQKKPQPKKVEEQAPAPAPTPALEKQLSPEEYAQLNDSLDSFQESFLSFLAGTSQFEIVPTVDEFGNPISEKNLELIRKECKRLGFKVLYSVDNGKTVSIINPETMKIGILSHITEVH